LDNNRGDRNSRRYGRSNTRSTGQYRSYSQQPQRRRLPAYMLVVIDVLGLGVAMLAFCLFFFMIPREIPETPVDLPNGTATHQSADPQAAANPGETATDEATAAVDATATPDDTSATETAAEPTATPDQTNNADQGAFGAKFADKFATGDPETTDNSYKSKDLSVTIEKKNANNITWYVADIYVRNLENFKTALAKGKYGKGIAEPTLDIANNNNAIVAISGDYYGFHETGVVVRNGKLYRKTQMDDVLVMNNDGTMQTFENKDFNVDDIINNGAWQAWTFGPMLLKDGQTMTKFNSTVNPANPRAAVGYYEPGHYCLVVVDGRQPGYSDGITLKAFSQLFYDMGCKAAYNLDGGQTAVMTFMGKWVNKPYNNGRNVSDIIYAGEKTN
jgi:exopolysaccharide biosynthesis protein